MCKKEASNSVEKGNFIYNLTGYEQSCSYSNLEAKILETKNLQTVHTFHASREQLFDFLVQILRGDPVTQGSLDTLGRGRDCLQSLRRADERPGLHPGHVLGISPGEEAVLVLEWCHDAPGHELGLEGLVLLWAAVHDVQVPRLAQLDLGANPDADIAGQLEPVPMDHLARSGFGLDFLTAFEFRGAVKMGRKCRE